MILLPLAPRSALTLCYLQEREEVLIRQGCDAGVPVDGPGTQ
jgi:hypothetical protein